LVPYKTNNSMAAMLYCLLNSGYIYEDNVHMNLLRFGNWYELLLEIIWLLM
jgi:hypothetical protein